jgi:hypothetical protein
MVIVTAHSLGFWGIWLYQVGDDVSDVMRTIQHANAKYFHTAMSYEVCDMRGTAGHPLTPPPHPPLLAPDCQAWAAKHIICAALLRN